MKTPRLVSLVMTAAVAATLLSGCATPTSAQDPCNVNPQVFQFDKELTFDALDANATAYQSSVSVAGTATIHQELKSCEDRAYDPTFITVEYAVSTPNSDVVFYDLAINAEDAESDGGVYKNNFATKQDNTQENVPGEKVYYTAEREIPSTLTGGIDLVFDFAPVTGDHPSTIDNLVVSLKH